MDINQIVATIRNHPDAAKIGMIATHLGLVRGTSRSGEPVAAIQVHYDPDALRGIQAEMKKRPGILEVVIEINEGRLSVGDAIMCVAVAGDIREHVFPALAETVERIKKEASRKQEFYRE
ncbi:MAG: molybdenum cofactor biosynthesis protein MoaE [Thermodesulfobacteriota bacterium]